MSTRGRLLGAIALLVLPAALVFGGLQVLRWHAMGELQREALALLQAEPKGRDGANAYAWLAVVNHEVPPDRVEAELAADALRFEAWMEQRHLQYPSAGNLQAARFVPLEGSDLPAREPMRLTRFRCSNEARTRCLSHVMDNLDEHRAVLAGESARLAEVERALASSHLSSPYGSGYGSPRLQFTSMYLELTAAAVAAGEGRPDVAFARACRLLDWSRRMSESSDDWGERSQLRSLWEEASALLLELRRAFPGQARASPCDRALAPLTVEEFVNCAAERRDLAFSMRDLGVGHLTPFGEWNPLVSVTLHLISHPPLRAAWQAQELVQACGPSAQEALATGKPLPEFEPALDSVGLACLAAVQTCTARLQWKLEAPVLGHRMWPYTANQWGRLQLLAAAHALADATPDGLDPIPLPEIPGFPVEHDAPGEMLVIRLREERKVTEYLVDIAGFTPPAPPAKE